MPPLSTNHLRYHWLIDGSLVSDVLRRHKISWPREATLLAAESIPSRSIRLSDECALWTSPACVARINLYHGYSQSLCLILDKALQLVKTPICHPSSLRLRGLNSFPDATQVFKGNGIGQALSRSYDGFTNAMVSIFLVSRLCARNLLEFALSRAGTFFLKILSSIGELLSGNVYRSSAVVGALRVYGNVYYAKIYPQGTLGLNDSSLGNLTCACDVKVPPRVHKINFTLTIFKKLALVLTAGIRNFFSTIERRKRNHTGRHYSKKFMVEGLCSMPPKNSQGFSIELIGISNLRDAAYRCLGIEPKLFPNRGIY